MSDWHCRLRWLGEPDGLVQSPRALYGHHGPYHEDPIQSHASSLGRRALRENLLQNATVHGKLDGPEDRHHHGNNVEVCEPGMRDLGSTSRIEDLVYKTLGRIRIPSRLCRVSARSLGGSRAVDDQSVREGWDRIEEYELQESTMMSVTDSRIEPVKLHGKIYRGGRQQEADSYDFLRLHCCHTRRRETIHIFWLKRGRSVSARWEEEHESD